MEFTDEQVREWMDRNNLEMHHKTEMRTAMEDAATLIPNPEVARLREALRDLLPYAEAAIGPSWRANPPSDSVITKARQALQEPRT